MRTISIGLAASLLLTTFAHAQDTPADWIRKLGSGSYVERERAAKLLEQKGKTVLPLLREAIVNADLETRRRALLLMERIENRALFDELITATPTRLRFQNVELNDALRSLEAKIALRWDYFQSKRRIEQIDTGELPYWQAWAKFCKDAKVEEGDYARFAAKLKMMTSGLAEDVGTALNRNTELQKKALFQGPRIELLDGMAGQPYAVDDRQSVRVRARWLMSDHQIDKDTPHAVFAIEVRADPRLEIIGTPRVSLTKIVDTRGNEKAVQAARILPATVASNDVDILSAFAGEVQYGGLLHLKAIPWPHPSGKLAALHGNVRLDVIVRPNLVEVPQVLKSVGKTKVGYDGILLKVLDGYIDEGRIIVHLHLDRLNSLTPQSLEKKFVRVRPGFIAERGAIDVAMERLELLDARGQKYYKVKSDYQPGKDAKGYDVELYYAAKSDKDEPTLVLTKEPRTVSFAMPFVVRDLNWEASRRP